MDEKTARAGVQKLCRRMKGTGWTTNIWGEGANWGFEARHGALSVRPIPFPEDTPTYRASFVLHADGDGFELCGKRCYRDPNRAVREVLGKTRKLLARTDRVLSKLQKYFEACEVGER